MAGPRREEGVEAPLAVRHERRAPGEGSLGAWGSPGGARAVTPLPKQLVSETSVDRPPDSRSEKRLTILSDLAADDQRNPFGLR